MEIRIRFGEFEFESNHVSIIREYSPRIRIRIMIVHYVIQNPVPGWMAREWQHIKADRRREYLSVQKRDSLISGDITNSSQSDRITVLECI
jgi:1-acyl-sn-glycerol-3-phosphate acyltransferase